MPRAVKKFVSSCSSRNSNRSSCRKRHSSRDTILSMIREAFRFCSNKSNRSSPFPMIDRLQPSVVHKFIAAEEDTLKINEPQEMDKPKGAELTNLVPQKTSSIITNEIRRIMLPLHLLNLCSSGLSEVPSSEATEKKTPSKFNEEVNDELLRHFKIENSSSKNISYSPKTSQILPVSITHLSSCINTEPITSISSCALPSCIPTLPTVKPSLSIHKNLLTRRILEEDSTEDESSDELVTAREYFEDDSSSDQWSSAISVQSMNMARDFGIMKISSNSLVSNLLVEEPMDVSMEDTSFCVKQSMPESNNTKSSIDSESTSSNSEDYNSISSHSTVDREIANILQSALSSSDEEDFSLSNGRRNNPYVSRSSRLGRSGFREEISDTAIRKKRTRYLYDRLGKRNTGSGSSSRSSEADLSIVEDFRKNIGMIRSREAYNICGNQTDSAYSDDDVEMNSINEAIIRLQSIHTMSLQESVVEWMDQDLEYVADSEDSNDGLPFPGRARIPSFGAESATSTDQGFVEDNERTFDYWSKNYGPQTFDGRILTKEAETTSKYWNLHSGAETINSQISLNEADTTSGNLNTIMSRERQILDDIIVKKKTGSPLTNWKDASETEEITEATNFSSNLDKSRRGLSRFSEALQHPIGDSCDCGNPNCIYLPLETPADFTAVDWIRNYFEAPSASR